MSSSDDLRVAAARVYHVPPEVEAVLACPACRTPIATPPSSCDGCGATYQRSPGGALDLRPDALDDIEIVLRTRDPLPVDDVSFAPLEPCPSPQVDFSGVDLPRHLTSEMVSWFPRAGGSGQLMLDIGCGDASHRCILERTGFTYVGVDYSKDGAPILGDAHALPFADESFDFVTSITVLEHIRHPLQYSAEAFRVLRPGGRFVGSVAFLEPYHGNSYYHHSHLGTLNTLHNAGFRVTHVAPRVDWNVVRAQARNGLFPKLPKPVAEKLGAPLNGLHRLWWAAAVRSGRATSELRESWIKHTTGAFIFVAHRDA